MTRTAQARQRLTVAGVALAVTATLAACTNTPTPDPTSSPTPTTTPSPTATPTPTESKDPEIAAAEAAVLATYQGFWDAQVAFLAAPNEAEPEALRQYAVDKALSGVRQVARLYAANGIVARGEPAISPEVTSVSLEGEPTATISDCVDSTDWQPVYADSGESAAAPGQFTRQINESEAIFFDGRWVVRETTVRRDRSC